MLRREERKCDLVYSLVFERNSPSARGFFVGQSGEEGIAQEGKEDRSEGVDKEREMEQHASRGKRVEQWKQDSVSIREEVLQRVWNEEIPQDGV